MVAQKRGNSHQIAIRFRYSLGIGRITTTPGDRKEEGEMKKTELELMENHCELTRALKNIEEAKTSNTSEATAGHTAGKMHFMESTSGQYRIFADGFAQAEVYPTMRPGAKRTEMVARIVQAVNSHDSLVAALK